MTLEGKVINFLGDSITEGCGTSSEEKRFTNLIERDYKLKKANNYGICGTRIAKQQVPSIPLFDQDFCGRFAQMDKDADAVVVFGGTNDYGHGDAPLGEMSDRTSDTFYGACHVLMSGLLNMYTGKPIVIVTPLHRLNENSPLGEGEKTIPGEPLKTYRKIIVEVAEYYALPILDLYATSGLQPENDACREMLIPDGLHPNDEGHSILARKIGNFLLQINCADHVTMLDKGRIV